LKVIAAFMLMATAALAWITCGSDTEDSYFPLIGTRKWVTLDWIKEDRIMEEVGSLEITGTYKVDGETWIVVELGHSEDASSPELKEGAFLARSDGAKLVILGYSRYEMTGGVTEIVGDSSGPVEIEFGKAGSVRNYQLEIDTPDGAQTLEAVVEVEQKGISLKTPDGTFEDVILMKFTAQDPQGGEDKTARVWFARGVGPVKVAVERDELEGGFVTPE
jgi:hypothetical protein